MVNNETDIWFIWLGGYNQTLCTSVQSAEGHGSQKRNSETDLMMEDSTLGKRDPKEETRTGEQKPW